MESTRAWNAPISQRACFTQRCTANHPRETGYVARLNADTAGKLQKTAWDSVTAFYGKAPDGSVRVIAQ